jgi:hypothetical protein
MLINKTINVGIIQAEKSARRCSGEDSLPGAKK